MKQVIENKNHNNLNFQQALEIVFHEMRGSGTRHALMEKVGEGMYNKLCVLGFISEGATINPKTKERIRVWKETEKPNLFNKIMRTQSEKEIEFLNRQIEFSHS